MDLAKTRRRFADSLGVSSPRLKAAFAAVPREAFLGPPPWLVLLAGAGEVLETSNPADLYRNALVALDAKRGINNGEPVLWAQAFDALGLKQGDSVVHVGAGTGYYTAILTETVGPTGAVLAIEIDPDLAHRARANLAGRPNVTLIEANAIETAFTPADAIIASAGLATIPEPWLDRLTEGGRLLLPLTATPETASPRRGGWGGMLLIRRDGDRFPARFLMAVGFYPCIGARDPAMNARLRDAFEQPLDAVRALKRCAPDATCWLKGEGWWLSTKDA